MTPLTTKPDPSDRSLIVAAREGDARALPPIRLRPSRAMAPTPDGAEPGVTR